MPTLCTVTAILVLSVTKVKKGDDTMVKKWQITIPELTGDITRNVYVYLPESYDPGTRTEISGALYV